MTSAVTTLAPVADTAPAAKPEVRSFDRAALAVFGTMVTLIVLLTALLVETSLPPTTTAADDAVFPASIATKPSSPGR